MRIASLVPAGTEIVWALGLVDRLVAVTHDCDVPPEVRSLPRLTASTIPPGATSGEIDALVRAAGERGESTFHVDAGAIRRARPDVIVGQTICRVCAVTLDQLPAELASVPRTIPLDGESIDGVLTDIRRVADALGCPERGEALVAELDRRLAAVAGRVAGRTRPRVACLEWLDPLFPGGHWVPEQVAFAGGRDVLGAPGRRGAPIEWDAVLAAAPEVVILMPCGFDTERAYADAGLVTGRSDFGDLPAARAGRVFAVDGGAHFSRPGPRLVDGVEILAAILHPDLFDAPPPEAARKVPFSQGAANGS